MRSRLPEELWAAAVELVQRAGIDATARALGMDKPSLGKWAGRNQLGESPKPSAAGLTAHSLPNSRTESDHTNSSDRCSAKHGRRNRCWDCLHRKFRELLGA